jgi:mannose-6-phosphate isomerase
VAADPAGWTGAATPPAGPSDVGLLVKLLDAGQRLPVHVHPTRPFARDHLHSCYGKTEAWYVLETAGADAAVWVGFREDVDPGELAARVDAQDSDWMLGHMNRLPVRPGDGVVVPAGQAHATGAGVFLVEAQEPTDFSILLEWSVTTATRDESHLGLGFDRVLPAVDHRALAEVAALHTHVDLDARGPQPLRLLAPAADPYVRVDLVAPSAGAVTVPHGFAVAIVVAGGELGWAGGTVEIARGQAYAVPDGLGDWTVGGGGAVVLCRPAAAWPELAD